MAGPIGVGSSQCQGHVMRARCSAGVDLERVRAGVQQPGRLVQQSVPGRQVDGVRDPIVVADHDLFR